jgi:hypothetical protein
MKKVNRLWLSGLIMLFGLEVSSQSYVETALLFSRIRSGGSARIQGMGGTSVSLGGDYSSAYSNPAGLGFFNRNEFTFSPSIGFSNASSNFLLGDSLLANRTDSKTTFTVPGISVVFHKDFSDVSNSVISGNFAITLNRINDFNSAFNYQGTNQYSSIINAFINTANGTNTSQFSSNGNQYLTPTWLAYQNFLIGDSSVNKTNGNPLSYFTDATQLPYARNGIPTQSEKIETSGGQNQISLAYGINVKDKFYVGAGLGITSLRYSSRKIYKETFDSGPLANLTFEENLNITGSGINLTLGTIYKPISFVQVGLSIATPTYYTLSDSYTGTMNTDWKNYTYYLDPIDVSNFVILNNESATTDEIATNYSLSTPWRFNGGITVLIKKKGFISVDIENSNYASSSYTSATDGVSFDSDNSKIKSRYKSIFAIRAGGEYRLKNLRFRAGYNYMPDPSSALRSSSTSDITSFSFGSGYRISKFYLDLGVTLLQNSGAYKPYPIDLAKSPNVKNSFSNTNIVFTVGFLF